MSAGPPNIIIIIIVGPPDAAPVLIAVRFTADSVAELLLGGRLKKLVLDAVLLLVVLDLLELEEAALELVLLSELDLLELEEAALELVLLSELDLLEREEEVLLSELDLLEREEEVLDAELDLLDREEAALDAELDLLDREEAVLEAALLGPLELVSGASKRLRRSAGVSVRFQKLISSKSPKCVCAGSSPLPKYRGWPGSEQNARVDVMVLTNSLST